MAHKSSVTSSYSKIKFDIAELLSKKGFVGAVSKKGKKKFFIEVALNYKNGDPVITDVKRESKSSRRIYRKSKEIYSYKNGIGSTFFSTPKGIMVDRDAKKENVGGEVLFSIW